MRNDERRELSIHMKKSTAKLFQQLRDRDKAIKTIPPISTWPLFQNQERPSNYAQKTLGYFADQLGLPVTLLLEQFSRAGIQGLTPNHRIEDSHKNTLLAYLRSQHSSNAQEIYRDETAIESQIFIVQEINSQLLQELAKSPRLMNNLPPRKYEELVAKLLEDQGCEVTLTKQTRDGGYDLFGCMKAGPTNIIFLAECKRYAPERKVGIEVVRGLYGVTEMQKANLGLIITTSSFTKDAYAEKVRIGPRIDLKEFSDLCNWLAPYSNHISKKC
jgi:HJR/Mrr/RecB family endonuclease